MCAGEEQVTHGNADRILDRERATFGWTEIERPC
jgi:hypothetical protein